MINKIEIKIFTEFGKKEEVKTTNRQNPLTKRTAKEMKILNNRNSDELMNKEEESFSEEDIRDDKNILFKRVSIK